MIAHALMLQWSPFRIEGETWSGARAPAACGQASMEPLPNRRGNVAMITDNGQGTVLQWSPFRIEGETGSWRPFASPRFRASMEPLPNRRGNV